MSTITPGANSGDSSFARQLAKVRERSTEEYFTGTVIPALYRSYPQLATFYSDHEQDMLCAALWWAFFGWKVFPTRGKVPAIANPHPKGSTERRECKGICGADGHGHHDATRDMETIRRWWMGSYRGADISVVVPDHYLCLDIDPRHGGDVALADLEAQYGKLPETLEVISGRGDGGRHLFFRRCLGPLNPTIADGIEVKTVSVMPPWLHDETHDPYRLIERTVADSTDWLLRRAIKPPPAPKPKRTPRPAHAGPSVAEAFNKTRTWNEILTPHGWRRVDGDGEADGSLWRHPDATHEWSASIRVNADGHSRLYVYSTNTPFQATTPADPHGYDRFDASAVLDHGGDVRALCDALARDPFRQKEA